MPAVVSAPEGDTARAKTEDLLEQLRTGIADLASRGA
jgi:hypothetical protein